MMYATTALEARAEATPKARGKCPACQAEVLAKCGKIVSWHWAHVGADCDAWSEPMTQWHLDWQAEVPPERREVVIGNHRADLVTAGGHVVELQHSSISVDDIQAREAHYDRMAWIFDARSAFEESYEQFSGLFSGYYRRLTMRDKGNYVTFQWKHPRKTLSACSKPIYLDLDGQHILGVAKLYTDQPRFGGWGFLTTRKQLVTSWINGGAG